MGTDLDRLKTKRAVLASGLFDAEFYRHAHPDIRSSPIDPLTHYLTQGEAEGRSPNPVFLPAYYRRHAPRAGGRIGWVSPRAPDAVALGLRRTPL